MRTELPPGGRAVVVEVHLQRRVLPARAKVPVRRGVNVVVTVQIVPVLVDAGVAGELAQLRGGLAPQSVCLTAIDPVVIVVVVRAEAEGAARGGLVVVAVGDGASVIPGQPAGVEVAGDAACGVAGGDATLAPPNQPADVNGAGNATRGVAGGDDRANVVVPGQPADVVVAGNAARGVAGGDIAPVAPDQAADVAAAGDAARDVAGGDATLAPPNQPAGGVSGRDVDARQPQVADNRGGTRMAEQPNVVRAAAVDEQVGDGVAVALQGGGEGSALSADGLPARPGVVGVVPVAVAVLVEVQVGGQLVAGAARSGRRVGVAVVVAGGAAHGGAGGRGGQGIGEGGGVVGGVGCRRRAVAVQVPADGVELGQGADLNEAVVVRVVIDLRRVS